MTDTNTTVANAAAALAAGPPVAAGKFEPARVQIEGHCGCYWQIIEVNPPASRDQEVARRVQAAVIQHAADYGHAPTYVETREHFWRAPDPAAGAAPVAPPPG